MVHNGEVAAADTITLMNYCTKTLFVLSCVFCLATKVGISMVKKLFLYMFYDIKIMGT